MRAKLETLKRIAKLYEAVEEAHLVELQQATVALSEVHNAVTAQRTSADRAVRKGREAIASGDRLGWLMADCQRKTSAMTLSRLEAVHMERKRLSEAAREQYVTSRRKSEQMQRLSAQAAGRVAMSEEKKAQAATDDRFAARQRWTGIPGSRPAPRRMKAS